MGGLCRHAVVLGCALLVAQGGLATPAGQYRLVLRPDQVKSSSPQADFSGLVDEQAEAGDPPSGVPTNTWHINSSLNKQYPFSATIDLGAETALATLWVYDLNGSADLLVDVGAPGQWQRAASYGCSQYQAWAAIPLGVRTRYLRLELSGPGAMIGEVVLDAYSAKGWERVLAERAEAAQHEAERTAALARAKAEALKRPVAELAPFGRLSLVDEIDCSAAGTDHEFVDSPAGSSTVATVLGSPCRVLKAVADEGSYVSYRVGRHKLLRPGAAYVLAVDYPEDAPRSMVVVNGGNETSRGFHTGITVGDALHPKYVNNFCESLDVPLSGQWEQWTLLFRLHDRFPDRVGIRGGATRPLLPDDGFCVTVAQFSAPNDPFSAGIAVRRIRLYEVIDPDKLAQPLCLPPADLPHRRLCWREEMADGVIGDGKKAAGGVDNPLDWYRYKAELMRFLGMNTYTKDLLEFGACQAWDPTPYGGNKWVYFNADLAPLWEQIVGLMGSYGFDVLPYYEYAGSKGQEGIGPRRRCKPLGRDDAYSHIKWIESSNADITDPDTFEDFRKMVDLTVVRLKDKARFAGVWIRPRSQMPVSFADATRQRFAVEANGGAAVTRQQLKADKALYARYIDWWELKRRGFFTAVRDYMRTNGVPQATVLFTGCPSEPGEGFGSWDPRFVADKPDAWKPVFALPPDAAPNAKATTVLTPAEVASRDLYLGGLLSPGLNWGGWELNHSRPADDPQHYTGTDGVLLTHAFNRLYTVLSPRTFDAYRAPAGLAIVRHYSLNENMMFDKDDKAKLGYFVADMERAGPYCMMAEAVAMANGDPSLIGYLSGGNFGRGFPLYARDFNANYLALPALPSRRLPDSASSDPAVVVRTIDAGRHGTYVAVVNTGWKASRGVKVRLPGPGAVTALVRGEALPRNADTVSLDLRPCQLVALRVTPP